MRLLTYTLLLTTLNFLLSQDHCEKVNNLINQLEKDSYRPPSSNKNYSELFLKYFFDEVDAEGNFLTQKEIQHYLESYPDISSLQSNSCRFSDELINSLLNSFNRAESILNSLNASNIKYDLSDSVYYDFNRSNYWGQYAKDSIDLVKYWIKEIKFNTLRTFYLKGIDSPSSKQLDSLTSISFENSICNLQQKKEEFNNEKIEIKILEALALAVDPHTNYFTASEMENFEEDLSADKKRFGFEVEIENNIITIQRFIPGSAAWFSGKLHKGDIITKVKFQGENEFSMNCVNYTSLTKYLDLKDDQLSLTVKKKSGKIEEVTLSKTTIQNEDNIISSFVFEDENKVGYINLPSFYTDFYSYDAKGCANDIAKEILKLKQDDIEALILDLRNNGGGSLEEAVALSGIFVDQGSLGILKYSGESPQTIKDVNRGTMFNKPLIVLVNGYSASASEFVAASLQDHNRALIVGDTTFGKATAQNINPTGKYIGSMFSQDAQPSYLKTTKFQLYRLNGISIQSIGVIPDIYLHNPYECLQFKESSYPNHISSDTVVKKTYYTPKTPIDVKSLILSHQKRDTLSSTKFETYFDVPLSPKEFYDIYSKVEGQFNQPEQINEDVKIHTPSYDNDLYEYDTTLKDIKKRVIKNLSKDADVIESFYIAQDLIKLNKP